jgi:hypothetical protein
MYIQSWQYEIYMSINKPIFFGLSSLSYEIASMISNRKSITAIIQTTVYGPGSDMLTRFIALMIKRKSDIIIAMKNT